VSSRTRRVEKLVEIAEQAVNAARASAAAAARAVTAAREDADRGERSWAAAAQQFGTGVSRSSDLDQQAAHVRTLRLRADEAVRRLERAITDESRCTTAVVTAALEHRKMELWRDRIAQEERDEENRLERRGSDELAARLARARA
jgi:hypothetical protein